MAVTPRPTRAVSGVLALALAGVLAGCGEDPDPGEFRSKSRGPDPTTASPSPQPSTSASEPAGSGSVARGRPRVVGTAATGLDAPWGVAFLPDGSALVTERDSGRVLHLADGRARRVGRVDQTSAAGESGLLGVAVSPTYDEDREVFLYVTTRDDNRVVRGTFDGRRLGRLTPILTGIPQGFIHDGGRLAFGPDGYLYVSTGETGQGELAQDAEVLGGKILRITRTGRPAPGNPRKGSPIWTLGHRNVQGLAFDDDENLWASEFGASTWDELNLVEKGNNYGWPDVEGRGDRDGYRNPQVVWRTSDASPSGLAWLDGHLWMASLAGERLWRVRVKNGRATKPRDYFVGRYGRLRTVVVAPDGNLWVTTSNTDGRGDPRERDDRILVVRP